MRFLPLLSTLVLFAFGSIHAEGDVKISEKTIEYKQGDTVLEGFLAEPVGKKGKLPAVVVIHEWDGLGDYVKRRARMLADLGYVAFAADIYGKGVRPQNPEESKAQSTKYKEDRTLLRERARAAFDEVASLPNVDPKKIAVMGYCFGGTAALELARSGASVKGVVSFHGGLATPTPEDAKSIKGKVLVLHGADDPAVPPTEVEAFKQEMEKAKVDLKFVAYPGAVHAFTNPARGERKPGASAAYDENADKKSWAEMQKFFKTVLR